MTQLFRPLPCLFAPYLFFLAALASPPSDAFAAGHKAAQPEKKHERKSEASSKAASKKEASKKDVKKRVAEKHHKKDKDRDRDNADARPELTGDLAVLRDVFDSVRHGKTSDATRKDE